MRNILTVLTALALTIALTVTAVADAQTITAISFANDNAVAEENLSVSGYGDKDSGYAASTIGGRLYASVSGTDLRKLEWSKGEYEGVGMQPVMTGGTKNPWGNGAYLEIRVPTAGFENIAFSAKLGGTKKGPRDFKLQYSTDGIHYTDVAGALFTIPTNKTMFQAFDNVTLPQEADNAELLYIRIAVASNMMIGGTAGLIGGTGGETAINDIVISGTPLANVTVTSSETVTTTASPDSTAASTTSASAATTTTTAMANVNTGDRATGVYTAMLLLVLAAGMVGLTKRQVQ